MSHSNQPKTIVKIIATKQTREIGVMLAILLAIAGFFGVFGLLQWKVCQQSKPDITFLDCVRNK
jgi:hypothetical protein